MMGFLVPIFARWGLSQRVAKAAAMFAVALALVLAVGALWLWLDSREAADDKGNQEIGAAVQREGALRETLERVEEANDVREEIERAGPAGDRLRYDQCVRSSRTPGNCDRYLLPQRPAVDDRAGAGGGG